MNFTAKFELAFIKTLENTFSLRFRFKITRKSIDSSRDFQNSSPFNRSACFYLTISGNYEHFLYFQKTEYRFLVESTKIENASFPYKSVMSDANVKTNRMVSTKLTYRGCLHENWKPSFLPLLIFASSYI